MTLHLYIARKFLVTFLAIFCSFLIILVMLDMVEQTRKFSSENIGLPDILTLSLLNAPAALYEILPLIMILATLALFLGLARTSEMVVTRAAGRSALHSLLSPVVVAVLIGVFTITIFNPIVAVTKKQYDAMANRFANGQASVLSLSANGLWLRQGTPDVQTVIHAAFANSDGTELSQVSLISMTPDGGPVGRIDAESARLVEGAWILNNVKQWPLAESDNPERDARVFDELRVPSDLTAEKIRDSFGDPSVISIWDLPSFIAQLERAGFSARQHRVWFQMELAQPMLLASMVLIGAAFTMRHTRFGRTGILVLTAILLGFGLFFIRNFAQILGENGQIPVLLAAWSPPFAGISLALAILLHTEDG